MPINLKRMCLVALLTVQATAYAGVPIYKWVEAGGIVNYATVPALNVSATLMTRPSLGVPELKAVENTPEMDKTAAKSDVKNTAAKEAFQNCENAKDAIRALESKAPVAKLTDTGTTAPLGAAARQSEKAKAVTAVTYWCEKTK